ncbi:restriction endonuclease subunit S [Helicobacter pylori]|uniref:restriction endonuclease subunit S n=2 Tax=Helicobacter pylori TaxID=210 RepID=UPI000FDEBC8A|nr:restriction endonuclease subunit S [Helicobacter pylori]RVZ48151.1 restriction endonuclease subunit S [Helicobacter pylori]
MHKIERLLQTLAPKGVEFRKLGDIGEFTRGNGLLKSDLKDKGRPVVHYGQIHTQYNLSIDKTISYVNEALFHKLKKAKPNDILIVTTSENVKDVGKSIAWLGNEEVAFSGEMYSYSTNENPKFIIYYFQTWFFQKEKEKKITGTKVMRIHENDLKKITIPIPPLEIQQEIVKVLDAFTELNTELNARKKQYEYYQNMLLDFNDINQNHQDAKMSAKTYPKRLKTLLQTLAPKGVEFRKLGEVLEYDQPNKYCVTSKEFDKSYPTPVLTAGKTFILGYTNEKDNIYQASKNAPVIIFDDFTTATQWVDFPFKVKSSAMKILLPKNPTINIRFIFFYMQTIPYNISGEHTRQWISRYSQLEVPIPPLEIQQEIVKILDQFSILTTDLLAGIPAEIKARKKQYEYYREKLLTFKPLTPLNNKELA